MKALGKFVTKDLQPYAMMEDAGCNHMIKILELQYNITCYQHFNITVILKP